ncbi:MAG: N-acetylmuramoyl-L-alanine amidase, partial [Holosporales bacterium]|nr:N-acetylmuramoyl-L-alanine amidase [Holosporales bacterium]
REKVLAAYYRNGTSAHILIDREGKVCINVDYRLYRAFHAGISQFYELTSLNGYSIGIECVNTLYGKREGPYPVPRHEWEAYTQEQMDAVGEVVFLLQRYGRIPGFMVAGHADIALGRKTDPGPRFDWQGLYKKFGVGFFPEKRQIQNLPDLRDEITLHRFLSVLGYHSDPNIALGCPIWAFCAHYCSELLSTEMSPGIGATIIRCITSLYKRVDPITHQRSHHIDEMCENLADEHPGVLSEFIAS